MRTTAHAYSWAPASPDNASLAGDNATLHAMMLNMS